MLAVPGGRFVRTVADRGVGAGEAAGAGEGLHAVDVGRRDGRRLADQAGPPWGPASGRSLPGPVSGDVDQHEAVADAVEVFDPGVGTGDRSGDALGGGHRYRAGGSGR